MNKVLNNLFDFSFKSFVTPKLVKYMYILSIALAAVWSMSLILMGFRYNPSFGLFTLISSPIFFLFLVSAARISLELVLTAFRIANYTAEMARAQRPKTENEEMQHDRIA